MAKKTTTATTPATTATAQATPSTETVKVEHRLQVIPSHPVNTEKISVGEYIEMDMRIPEFQRDANQWSVPMCWNLLDTIRYGRIVPSVALGIFEGDKYLVDGLQRHTALKYLDKQLQQAIEDATTEDGKERLTALYDAFLGYELPIISQEYDKWADMVSTFESLNAGKPLNAAQKAKGQFNKAILEMLNAVKTNKTFTGALRSRQQKVTVDNVDMYGDPVVPNLEKLATFIVNAYLNSACTSLGVATKNLKSSTDFDVAKMPSNLAEINRRLGIIGDAYSSFDADADRKIITRINQQMVIVVLFDVLGRIKHATADDVINAIYALWDNEGVVKKVTVKQKGFTVDSRNVFAAGASNSVTETNKKIAIVYSLVQKSIVERETEDSADETSDMAQQLVNAAE